MIRFPPTKEVNDTIRDFKASLRQAIGDLCKLVLPGKIDGCVPSAIDGVYFGTVNQKKFDLS